MVRRSSDVGLSLRGTTHGADRWNTVRWLATLCTSGTTWIEDAPVPITATRLPTRFTE